MLIFDGDCGFCTSSARWIEAKVPDDVEVVPWQSVFLDEFGLTETQVTEAAWWVDDVGNLHRGHEAIGRALISAGGGWAVLGRTIIMPPWSWLAGPVYALVARFRHRLPGSTDACRIDRP